MDLEDEGTLLKVIDIEDQASNDILGETYMWYPSFYGTELNRI